MKNNQDNQPREQLKQFWYKLLDPAINSLSLLALIIQENQFKKGYLDSENIAEHEGHHKLCNPRYKEWWYFDLQSECGRVISCSIVFSLLQPHYFVWIFDPNTNTVIEEIQKNGEIKANQWGSSGVSLEGDVLKINGKYDEAYNIQFEGDNFIGEIDFFNPILGRGDTYIGQKKTYYALYQIPALQINGTLVNKATQETIALSGKGYHDHWWGIANRAIEWNWMQVKFDNGWVAAFYEGRYGRDYSDLDRYAWLYQPETGYIYFDNNSLVFKEIAAENEWSTSISGEAGSLEITSIRRVQRYEHKPLELFQIPVGEVDYYQYPIIAKGEFVNSTGEKVLLNAEDGILEWNFFAIW